jgi:hypothetical protein
MCLKFEEKHGNPQSGTIVVRIPNVPNFLYFKENIGWPADHQFTWITYGNLSHGSVFTGAFHFVELRGFPHEMTLS